MSHQIRCCVPICTNVGIKPVDVRRALSLAERFWAPDDGPTGARRQRVDPEVELEETRSRLSEAKVEHTLERIKRFYCHLAQDWTSNYIMDILDGLLVRDCYEVSELSGDMVLEEVVCVPMEYISRCPTIPELDQTKLKQSLEIDNLLLEDKKLSADTKKKDYHDIIFGMARGDLVEKTVFKVLKEFFTNRNQNVVIINGIEMDRINPERKQDSREIDLLVINHTLGLIINIECQSLLDEKQWKGGAKSKMAKLKEKIEANKNFFDDWFGADICERWKFVSIFYCEELGYTPCSHCQRFLAKGEGQLKQVLDGLVQNTPILKPTIPVEEFKTLVKFLIFCTAKFPLPIGLNFHNKLGEAMEKQGSKDNIQVWCFPTPQQKTLLYQDHLLFMAAWGTGKTFLMTWKAMQLARQNQKVLFLVFTQGGVVNKETVLFLDLQKKFQQDENLRSNIAIKQIMFVDRVDEPVVKYDQHSNLVFVSKGKGALKSLCDDFHHVMVDEFFENFEHLSQESQAEIGEAMAKKKTLWVALSNQYGQKTSTDVHQISGKLQGLCKNHFHVAKMDMPLRSPRNVYERLQGQVNPTSGTQIRLNDYLLKHTRLPPTLTDGRLSPVRIPSDSSLMEILQACFKELPPNKVGVIVIESWIAVFPEQATCGCRSKAIKSLFDDAFQKLGRETPLFWLDEYSDSIEEIKAFKSSRFLVTNSQLVRGFEDNLIINLAGFQIFSRSSAYLVTVIPTPRGSYLALPALSSIIRGKHDTSFAHDLTVDSPLSFIGKK